MDDASLLLRDKYNGIREPAYAEDLKKLESGEPLAYVIGWIPFLNTRIYLDSRPLIPRPETEWWTEELINKLNTTTPYRILDLFAGSGAIGIALLKHLPQVHVTFGEIEKRHLDTIIKNIDTNNIDSSRASLVETDIFSAITDTFDLIVANPPYIPLQEKGNAAHELQYEPAVALYADDDGLALIKQFLSNATKHLHPGGLIYMEFNEGQEAAIMEHCASIHLRADIRRDQYGRMRLLVAQYTR